MLNIVCVRWGTKFSRDYVNILYHGIKRHYEGEFRFICVTDDPEPYDEGIESVTIPEGLTGWWGKLWLFSKEFQEKLTGQAFFFDLDTVIVGHLDEFFKYKGDFAILRDFYRFGGYGSGLMSWKKGFGTQIWDYWVAEGKPEIEGGDQAWIEKVISGADLWQEIFPEWVVSYKCHAEQWPPSNSKIVCFHGFPKPHECKGGWVEKTWSIGGLSKPFLPNNGNTASSTLLQNIEQNCKRDVKWLNGDIELSDTVVIVGGAPSLKDNYKKIRDRQKRGQTIIALNGTLDFLMEKGIKPDYAILMDAREVNLSFYDKGHDVKYLINAMCNPKVFDKLADKDVYLWHSFSGDDDAHLKILENYPDKPWALVSTGNTVGLTCLVLFFALGVKKFHLYGMDSSYSETEHHAYKQKMNDGESIFSVFANGKEYKASIWMMRQAENFQEIFRTLIKHGCSITAHGSGLLPDVCQYLNSQTKYYLQTGNEIGETNELLQNG